MSVLWVETSAQSSLRIVGLVQDNTNAPIELASILIRSTADSSIVAAEYSQADGRFSVVTGKVSSSIYVEISFLGYVSKKIPLEREKTSGEIDLGIQVLQTTDQALGTVTITAKKPYIERRSDRTIVNLDALLSNTGANLIEALENAPGISTDANGLLMLRGRLGVAVFIDDKPTYLEGEQLANYLKSLPASSVKSIEIMTNPPAKYEAAGNAGVINIITKKNSMRGFWGNFALGLTRGLLTRSNNNLSINYNQNRFGIFANIGAGLSNTFQDLNINRYYLNSDETLQSSFAQNSYILKEGHSLNGKLGMDFYLNEKTTLSGSFKGMSSPLNTNTDNTAFVRDASAALLNRVLADNLAAATFRNETYTLNFRQKLDSLGSQLSADADFVRYESNNNQDYLNFIYSPLGSLDFQDNVKGVIPSTIRIWAGKIDWVKQFNQPVKVEAGLKSARTSTDNEAIYETTVGGVTSPDYNLSNRFLYDEWIHAGYLNGTLNRKQWEIQAGLRGEWTFFEGNQLGNPIQKDTSFSRDYFSVFPTVNISFNPIPNGQHSWDVSYGKRIDRPIFQHLNPFISPLDKFTFYTGNPNLKPTYAHNFSLTHTFKQAFSTSLNYSNSIDGIYETLEIVDKIYFSRPNNTAKAESVSISFQGAPQLRNWWSLNYYTELGHNSFSGPLYAEQLDAKAFYAVVQLTNTLTLGKGWNAEVRGNYQSDIVHAQLLVKSFWIVNSGVSKLFWKKKATAKININDIFYTRRADGVINFLTQTNADWNSRLDTRSVSITFSYRFGNAKGEKSRVSGSGSDSEQKRVSPNN